MEGLNCKTYVEGKGWLYNHELTPKTPKTVEESVSSMIEQLSTNNAMARQIKALKEQSVDRSWETPTRDAGYIRNIELNKKYAN